MSQPTSKIQVIPFDPKWKGLYEKEAKEIQNAVGKNFASIDHVGSTSIEGLAAKPKIDILLSVNSPKDCILPLEAIGYTHQGEYNIPMHFGFSKRGSLNVNLHVYEKDHPEIELNLTFRNYLRAHPKECSAYASLKKELLTKKSSFTKNHSVFSGYNLGKDRFIRHILKQAGFKRLRMVFCTHYLEWEAAKVFRQNQNYPLAHKESLAKWAHANPKYKHFILYQGIEIIGYAEVKLQENSSATLNFLVVNESAKKKEQQKQFLEWISSWLQSKQYHNIQSIGLL